MNMNANTSHALYTAVASFDRDAFHLYSVVSCAGKLTDLRFIEYNNPNRLRMDGSSPYLAAIHNLGNTRILLETQAPTTDLIRTKLDGDGNLLARHLSEKYTAVWEHYNPKRRYGAVHVRTGFETLKTLRDDGERLVPRKTLDRMLSESMTGQGQISVIKATNQKDVGTAYYVGRIGDNGGVPVSTTYPDLAAWYANEHVAKEPATQGGDIVPLLYELYPDLKLGLLRKFFQTPRYVVLLPDGRYVARRSSYKTTGNLENARTFGEETDADLLDQTIASLYEAYKWSDGDPSLRLPVQHEYDCATRLAPNTDGCKPWKPKL